MHFTTLLATLLAALALAQSNAIISLALSTDSACASAPQPLDMETNRCYLFGETQGMRVTHHSAGAKYDALRVFKSENCDVGAEWKVVDIEGGVCEDVAAYKAVLVKLVD